MRQTMLRLVALGALLAGVAMKVAQPGDRPREGKDDLPPGPPPRGEGRHGPPRFQLGKVLPPFAVDQLDLTEEQKEDIARLEKEVKQRLEKILTAEQRRKLENLRPPHPPRPGGRPGGPPDDDNPPPRGERPADGKRPPPPPPPPPPDRNDR